MANDDGSTMASDDFLEPWVGSQKQKRNLVGEVKWDDLVDGETGGVFQHGFAAVLQGDRDALGGAVGRHKRTWGLTEVLELRHGDDL